MLRGPVHSNPGSPGEAVSPPRQQSIPERRSYTDEPANLAELFDIEHPDYGDPDEMFRHACVANLKQILLTQRRMSQAAAREFISKRVTVDVKNACLERPGEIRTLAVVSRIQAADDPSKAVELQYDYHHRVRWSELEHFATLKFTTHSMDGFSKVFQSTHEDAPLENARQVERRNFFLTEGSAKAIRDSVFGEDWSLLQALLMCYAAAGVCYGCENIDLPSAAECPGLKLDWLEHNTRKTCTAVSEEDDGYETEPFDERYEAELSSARARARAARRR